MTLRGLQGSQGTPSEPVQPWSQQVSLTDWFENDPDLIAVINDAVPVLPNRASLQPYNNRALRRSKYINRIILPALSTTRKITSLTPAQQDFQRWLKAHRNLAQNGSRGSLLFENHVWSCMALHDRWIVIRGVALPAPTAPNSNADNWMVAEGSSQASYGSQYASTVRCFMSEPLSVHQAFVRDFDWESTPLGAMANWDSQLIETVSLTLTGTDPAAVFWGSDMTSVYNEAFITIAGQKHPAMMGDSPVRAFAEVWDQFFEPRIQLSRTTKEPFCERGLCLLLERLGYPEETFMTFTFLPLLGYSGEVVGFYHTVTEETQQILSKRRMSLLLDTNETLSKAHNLDSFWSLIIESLTTSELDTPFAVLYSVSEQEDKDLWLEVSSDHGSSAGYCRLEGSVGYPSEHQILSRGFWLHDDDSVLSSIFRTSMESRTTRFLSLLDKSLSPSVVQNLQKRGFSDECSTVAICPLRPTTHDAVMGFLVIGLSSRRPCDTDYRSFISLLVQNISSSLASVVLLEDEKRRGISLAERAAYESAQLTARLQERELENEIQEHKFAVMAHQVPVGIFDLAPNGDIKFCNQAWYDMTGHKEEDVSLNSWLEIIHEDDRDLIYREWTSVAVDLQPVSFEARFKKPWQAESGDRSGARLDCTWSLARMYPVVADVGTIVNVIGSFTDISFQKYAMAQQIQQIEEAIEAKRQQENFMDMTCHEMRNPLNAMLLCAQELSDNLQNISVGAMTSSSKEALATSIDSADTIIYCGRHQRRIIDDILTLSKLDAKLLQISPIEVRPVKMVQDTLKLFESEVRAQSIDVGLQVDEAMQQLEVANVMLDPSRVTQILVNFIANAIKFTKTEETRQILVTISASMDRPSTSTLAAAGIQLIPHGGLYQDPTVLDGWGPGSPIHLQFTVRDTGPGISSDDMLKLFNRFAQTRPKTHAHYGGSGLGLFISQQLAELQGGRVGIASQPGVGSAFYFDVKAKIAKTSVDMKGSSILGGSNKTTQLAGNINHVEQTAARANMPSVLIVEDNLVNQKVLKRQLQKLGYNVFVANHGEEALNLIRQSQLWTGNAGDTASSVLLHIVLMDIEMPVMDGRECIQRIREYERQNLLALHVPVIALTANARPEQMSGARGYGFDEVLSKPFQLSQVVEQITKILG